MKETKLGTGAILLATIIWGMTFAFIKDAVAVLAPFNFLFWRFGIASILLLLIFSKKIKLNRQILSYGIILGLLLMGTVGFQTAGLRYTTASTASFITGLSVILVAIFEAVLNKRWPSWYVISSAILAIIGIGFITLANGITISKGDILILFCAFSFAGYILIAGKASKIHAPFALTFIQSIFICLAAGGISLITRSISIPVLPNVWIAIIFCGVFASVVAFILQLQFQKYVTASKAAIIFSLEPVFATITAAIFLKEKLSIQFFIGALFIFAGILLSERRRKEKVIPQE